MPGPLDLLKRLYSGATTPLVSEEAAAPYINAVDSPSLERSPVEAGIRGFGAGALEGLRGMTTPLDLAGFAAGGIGAGARGIRGLMGAGRAAEAVGGIGRAARAAEPTLDVIENIPTPQQIPGAGEVDDLINELHRNLSRVPSKGMTPPRAVPSLPPTAAPAAEFAHVGGEGAYNAARAVPDPRTNTDLYNQLMKRFGGVGR
jgi:hypothetical protein